MNLGEVIKNTRLHLNLTQWQVCDAAQLTQGFYSRIENGLDTPGLDTLQRICKVFDLPLFWVVWRATEIKDIPKSKRQVYNNLKSALDNYLDEITNLQ